MKEDAFIANIRSALDYPALIRRRPKTLYRGGATDKDKALVSRVLNRTAGARQRLLKRLMAAAGPLNLKVVVLADLPSAAAAIAQLVEAKETEWGEPKQVAAWRHPLIERLNLNEVLKPLGVPLFTTDPYAQGGEPGPLWRKKARENVVKAYIGVTSAAYCLADSGTLVMRADPGQARSVSLVPSIHLAVIGLDRIIADLKELYALLRHHPGEAEASLGNCLTFVTGPSKTADIEATMVLGAHGPREVHLLVVTGDTA